MIFGKDNTTTIVSQENISLKIFLENLDNAYKKIKNDNLIINLFSFSKLTSGDILEFLQLSEKHRRSNKSFVLVTTSIDHNDIPDGIFVVPTLQEAKDIIEMEEIERDLYL